MCFIAYDDAFLKMVTTFSKYFFLLGVTQWGNASSKEQMNTNTDQHFINQVLSGNTNAFSVLVERYKDLVFTLALRMLKHREEAEEVSQDTFIKVFKKLNSFKGDSKFSTWIYKVAYYTCLDRLKTIKKEYAKVAIDEFTEHHVKTLDNAFEAMVEEEKSQKIKQCIQLLPAEDSALLTLFYFEEQSLDEIASILGITANNVKVKLFRSRKKLASMFKENLEPEILESYER